MDNLSAPQLRCGSTLLDLSHPVVMGVLNVTPDSFSDGGSFVLKEQALAHAAKMLADGAQIVDVGGESTRPGACAVSVQQELDRVVPVVELLVAEFGCVVSVDTSTPEVVRESAAVGAGLINDVRALQREGAIDAVAASGLPVCLMHMQGQPGTMQDSPVYLNIVEEVTAFFAGRIDACVAGGVSRDAIVLDPGFGFGKSLQHNLLLLKGVSSFSVFDMPLLVGVSRKTMIGAILDKPVHDRVSGSVAAAMLAVERGAGIVRVHDVAETVDALKIVRALREVRD
ncbi:dihydropteroate synthase [Gammaproteobacteria bacterium 45_16_T64]|nr:dihydropteroate synthase [Gammaproteobacteria bacterium 45_16_T64]